MSAFTLEAEHVEKLKAAQSNSIMDGPALDLYADLDLDLISNTLRLHDELVRALADLHNAVIQKLGSEQWRIEQERTRAGQALARIKEILR